MSEKQGIEIDYCPDCRGVWLDRGELEKIIERTASPDIQTPPLIKDEFKYFDKHYDSDHHDSHGYKYGRKKNFLSELFD
jgi:Zn-finger nucleic acid-binding protein